MNSEQILSLAPAFAGGIVIGALNYLGLWRTVRQVRVTPHPTLLILLSMAVRTLLTMAAFYLVMGHEWPRLLACVAGYFLVRLVVLQRVGNSLPAALSG